MFNGYPFASFEYADTWTEDFEYEYARGCYFYTENYYWTDYANYAFYGGPNAGYTVDGVKRMSIDYSAFCSHGTTFGLMKDGDLTEPSPASDSSPDTVVVIGVVVSVVLSLVAAFFAWAKCCRDKRANRAALASVALESYSSQKTLRFTMLEEDPQFAAIEDPELSDTHFEKPAESYQQSKLADVVPTPADVKAEPAGITDSDWK